MSRIIALFGSRNEPNICYNGLMKTIKYIWQQPDWPSFTWDADQVAPWLKNIQFKQGLLLGKSSIQGERLSLEASLNVLIQNIVTSSAIEGERLNVASLRSSLAKRLGLPPEGSDASSPRSEGLAQIMFDAINHTQTPLSLARLIEWHEWLFPEDKFTLHPIQVGCLRGGEPMQIVSGRIDKPTIHYEAPPREGLEKDLDQFIVWFNQSQHDPAVDPLVRAAVAHLWFEVLHPFEDGNGRIGRAITDLALAQANREAIHYYAISATLLKHRKDYYAALEQAKNLDITAWVVWFLKMLDEALSDSLRDIERVTAKARFWQENHAADLSSEQMKVLNRLFEGGEKGFEQGISASQYQKVAKVSKATATRHLADLLQKGCIEKLPGGGRNTRYHLAGKWLNMPNFGAES